MFDLTAEEARLLLNIALMAVGRNRFRSAAKILAALDGFRSDSPQLAVTKAIALMSALQYADALDFLEVDALRHFPGNPMLMAFRGMALLRLNRAEDAQPVLVEVARQTDDSAAAQLAEGLLKG